jgi:DNA polymerase-3 subunit delta'
VTDRADGPFERYGRPPPPRGNWLCLGHDDACRGLASQAAAGRLAHAWLITGPAGIGKATLAFRFARWLLAAGGSPDGAGADLGLDPDHPVFRRVASGGHADLLTVERAFDEKRGRHRTEIVVEDVRRIPPFFAATPAEGAWRIVVVDAADQMTLSAANALLKVLEEPPPLSLLLLVAERPGALPATVRSRCRRLALTPLADATVDGLLARYRPDLGGEERARAVRLAEGSIGRALALADAGLLALEADLVRLLLTLPALDGAALHAFCDRATAAAAGETAADEVLTLITGFLRRVVLAAAGGQSPPPRGDPDDASRLAAAAGRLARAAPLDHWLTVWDNVGGLIAAADTARLDRRQVLLSVFFQLRGRPPA